MNSAFLFPGQGAQVIGMGKDFFDTCSESRDLFEKGQLLLSRPILRTIFEGPQELLTETRFSQPALFLTSLAILASLKKEIPDLKPAYMAGLSLGEYTALCASGSLSFNEILPIVQYRADVMQAACQEHEGTMAAIIGLDKEKIEQLVQDLNMPYDLWIANYNCPGQYVLSGTKKGVDSGCEAAKKMGAKLVMPLNVSGAFHSGLMQGAEDLLREKIERAAFQKPQIKVVMNRPGKVVDDVLQLKQELIKQVTSPVRWEQSIQSIQQDVDLFIEIGSGKTLAGMNRKMGCKAPTISINRVDDIIVLKKWLEENGREIEG